MQIGTVGSVLSAPEKDIFHGLLIYTDGLIEGRIVTGPDRLGGDGLIESIEALLRAAPPEGSRAREPRDEQLLDELVSRVRQLNGGELDDDLAMLALGYPAAVPS